MNKELQPSVFNSLKLSTDQLTQLQLAVTGFVTDFDLKQKYAPGHYPGLSDAEITGLLSPPPERTQVASKSDLVQLLGTVERACESGIETASGKQLSYIPGCGQHTAAIARYLGSVLNRFTGQWSHCPGAVALEKSVIDWMLSLFDFNTGGGGVLLSGASLSNFTAIVAARDQMEGDYQTATVYVSENTHHSVIKGCRLAGIPANRIRIVGLNNQHSMHMGELKQSIIQDLSHGLKPALIVATAGSTDTGAVDDLEQCAKLASEHRAWFHVDAAYGGFFTLTERGKQRMAGIEKADSIVVDAHKSLFMPYGIGALLVADRSRLDKHDSEWGGYMRDVSKGDTLPDFCLLGPELTRPFRGLEMWLPLHVHGVDVFRQLLDTMLDLAIQAKHRLANTQGIELVSDAQLSIITFRCCAGDHATQALLKTINASGHAHVSSCSVQGKLALRLVFLSPYLTEDMLTNVFKLIEKSHCEKEFGWTQKGFHRVEQRTM